MCTGWAAVEQNIARAFRYTLEYLDEALTRNGLVT